MFKKMFTMLLVLIMAISLLSACGKKEETTDSTVASDTATDTKETSKTESAEEETPQEIQTFTMFSEDNHMGLSGKFDDPVAQKITEATGVKLDMSFPVGEVDQKIGILLASGEYPDMVMVKDTTKFVDAEAYVDLEPLMKEHAPNLMKLYGDYLGRLRWSGSDSSIYVLPVAPMNAVKWVPNAGFELQHAAVKEAGFPAIKTLQDYEAVIQNYVDKYPEIDGQPTIGVTLCADDWRWLISIGNNSAFVNGIPDDGNWYVNPETLEAEYRFMRDDHKEYYKWLNHMNAIGLLDPDSFTQKFDAYEAKIASGRVVGLIDAAWEFGNAQNVLKTDGKFERMYGSYPVQQTTATLAPDFIDLGYASGYGIGITTSCEDPVAVIKFLDYMASDEGQVLRHWGIEGVNYVVENGLRVIPETEKQSKLDNADYNKETGVGAYVYPFPTWGAGVADSTGSTYNPETPESIILNQTPIEKEVLAAYGVEKFGDLYPTKEDLYISPWGAAWQIQMTDESGVAPLLLRCDEIAKAGVIESVIATPENFEKVWNQMISDLEAANVYDMNAKFTELVKERVAIWSK